MIGHFDPEAAGKDIGIALLDLSDHDVNLVCVTRKCRTLWAVLACDGHAVCQVAGHVLSAETHGGHGTGTDLLLRYQPAVEGRNDGLRRGNCTTGIGCCQLSTGVADDVGWRDVPPSQEIYECYLHGRAEWLRELGLVESAVRLGLPKFV